MKNLDALIEYGLANGCSDIHLTAGTSPVFRKDGRLHRTSDWDQPTNINAILSELLKQSGLDLKAFREKDGRYQTTSGTNVRYQLFKQRGETACAIRLFRDALPDLDALMLPEILKTLTDCTGGLILITGPTGSGKTTTLAAMLERINQTRSAHIITLEDPIETFFENKLSLIHQREIGSDTDNFHSGIRSALREDPDILLIGEMRDPETIAAALTAAETGHLVLSTLHTSGAAQTINRIIDVFPAIQQNQIRSQLSEILQGIVSQKLILRKDGNGRIPACEILLGTPAVKNIIRDNKPHQLNNAMLTGGNVGMKTMDAFLADLVHQELITLESAKNCAFEENALMQFLF